MVKEGERETERDIKTRKCYHHREGTKTGYRTRPCIRILVLKSHQSTSQTHRTSTRVCEC